MKVLITDGENRSALAATRSLGKRGCAIVVIGCKYPTLASCSKLCSKGVAISDPNEFGKHYAQTIKEIVTKEKIDVIFPMTEVSIHYLNEIRNHLPQNTILACSPAKHMTAVSNKIGRAHV